MSEYPAQPVTIVPTLVEGLKNVDELCLAEAVEVGDDGGKLVDHIFLLVGHQWSEIDSNGLSPRGEAVVWAGSGSAKA